MLIDPQSITVATATTSLPRQLTGTEVGRFVSPLSTIEVSTSATRTRVRTTARLAQKKVTADPLVATVNVVVDDAITLTINRPVQGFSDQEILDQVKGFIGWLTASTDKVLKQVIAGEN